MEIIVSTNGSGEFLKAGFSRVLAFDTKLD